MNPPTSRPGRNEPRIICAGNRGPFTLGGTQTYLVGRERVAVIDPGPNEEAHIEAVSHAVGDATEVTLLLTHRHSDHAGAAPALGEYPGAVGDYLEALDRIAELGLQVIYPAHGPPLRDPTHTISEYRQHRVDRIREVAAARDAHPDATAAELAELVYGSRREKLQEAARRSVEVILTHLDSTSATPF